MADMNTLAGELAELRFTIEVKRAATGETETFEMVGHIQPESAKEEE